LHAELLIEKTPPDIGGQFSAHVASHFLSFKLTIWKQYLDLEKALSRRVYDELIMLDG
jgi:hypothetical protein